MQLLNCQVSVYTKLNDKEANISPPAGGLCIILWRYLTTLKGLFVFLMLDNSFNFKQTVIN